MPKKRVENRAGRFPLTTRCAIFPYALEPPDAEIRLIRPPMSSRKRQMWTLFEIFVPMTVKRTSTGFALLSPLTIPRRTATE